MTSCTAARPRPAGGQTAGAEAHVCGGTGNDTIFQFTGDADIDGGPGDDPIVDWDDGGAEVEMIVMRGDRGDDDRGVDVCQDGDTTSECELSAPPTDVAHAADARIRNVT